MMTIAVIREGKVPPDSRVPLTPDQCAQINALPDVNVIVQSSSVRTFNDDEYAAAGLQVLDDISSADILLGVKEVPIEQLIADKTYFFFSHTIKEQAYNRPLLLAILEKNIRLVDYEVLTDEQGKRVIAFGRFAGMVGAHNGLLTFGKRTGTFDLKPMNQCFDYAEAKAIYKTIAWPKMKIVTTGNGRVGNGAVETLLDMGIKQVSPSDFLNQDFDEAVFTQLGCQEYVKRKDGAAYSNQEFYDNPLDFESAFEPYSKVADLMINGIFWDSRAPQFFSAEDMAADDFNIKVIADVTCDIAPESSIPSTLHASTISDPIFGYDPKTQQIAEPHQDHFIDMMTIDNLPSEMPRDASASFGDQFINYVLPDLRQGIDAPIIKRGTVAANGDLTLNFEYLRDYVNGFS